MVNSKILVVDDAPHIVEMLKIELEHEGFAVVTATNKDEAISIAKKEDIDIGFFDLNLPNTNGVEIYEEIKKFRPKIRGVIFTGTAETYTKLQTKIIESGMIDKFLRKPLEFGEVARVAKELLGG